MKIKSICLALCVFIILTGCSVARPNHAPQGSPILSEENAPHSQSMEPVSSPSTSESMPEKQLIFKQLALPQQMTYLSTQCIFQDSLIAGGLGPDGPVAARISSNDSWVLLPLPETYEFIYTMGVFQNQLVLLCGTYPAAYHDSETNLIFNDKPQGRLSFLFYDASYTLTKEVPLKQQYNGNNMTFQQFIPLDDGIILSAYDVLVKVSPDGEELAHLSAEERTIFLSACMVGETIYALSVPIFEPGSTLITLDSSTLQSLTQQTFPQNDFCGLGAQGDALLLNDKSTNLVTRLSTSDTALDWSLLGFAGQSFLQVNPIPDGWLFYKPDQDAIFYATLDMAVPKIILNVASDFAHPIQAIINEFNRSQDKYQAVLTLYTPEQQNLDALAVQITSGNSPDIFYFSNPSTLPDTSSAVYCENLLPYLETDSQIHSDYFVPSLLSCMMEAQQLFWLPYAFQIDTITAPASIFPDPGITLDDVDSAFRTLDASWRIFPSYMTDEMLLYWVSQFAMGSFVDFEHHTCNFTGSEFMDLLTLCKQWGGTGDSVMNENCLLQVEHLQTYLRLYGIHQNYQGSYTYVGFPNHTGNGNMFSLLGKIAMSNQSDNPSGAWEFLRFAVSPDSMAYLRDNGFSAAQSVLMDGLDRMMLEGNSSGSSVQKITQDDKDQFLGLLANTHTLAGQNNTLLNIIQEEAIPFFRGSCSAADAADKIQNRAALYLMEQQ